MAADHALLAAFNKLGLNQLSVGIAALASPALGTAKIDAATTALRAVVEHRDDLVKTRTQTVNRLHVVLTRLVPAGAGRHLSADHAADLLRGVRPRDAAAKTLRALAMDLVSEVRQLDRRIAVRSTTQTRTGLIWFRVRHRRRSARRTTLPTGRDARSMAPRMTVSIARNSSKVRSSGGMNIMRILM
jgi:hypothetical protein